MLLGSALPITVGVVSFVVLPFAGVLMTGAVPLLAGGVVVSGVAALLAVFCSPATGKVVALNTGCVPTALTPVKTGTLKPLLLPALMGPRLAQVTICPLVLHTQPLLLKLAGALMPLGNVTVVVMKPSAAPLPLLVMVTGKLLVAPATNAGVGWPMAVVTSGEEQLATRLPLASA